ATSETRKKTRGSRKSAASKGAKKKSGASKKTAGANKGGKRFAENSEARSGMPETEGATTETNADTVDIYEDAEAGITDGRSRAEFATRRGGRRRRRPGKHKLVENEVPGSDGRDEEPEAIVATEEEAVPERPAPDPPE